MPTPTTRLGLSKPLGNETVSRAAYSAVLDEIDAAVAGLAAPNKFLADQGIGAKGTADSGVTGYDSYDDYLEGAVWDGSASAPRYRRFIRRVKATPSASYLQLAYQAEGSAEVPLIEISAAGALRPAADGGGSLGEATRRWSAAYVQTLDISGSVTLANTAYLKAKDKNGAARNILGVDSNNVLLIGDAAMAGVTVAGTFTATGTGTHVMKGHVQAGDGSGTGAFISNRASTGNLGFLEVKRGGTSRWYFETLDTSYDMRLLNEGVQEVLRIYQSGAVSIQHVHSGTGSPVGVRAIVHKTTSGAAHVYGFNTRPVADAVTITNFHAILAENPQLLNGGAVTNCYFAYVGDAYVQTTVGPAGSASPLPGNPRGYLKLFVNGMPVVIPYYNAA